MKTYDPKQVAVIVGGRQISGYADGTFVQVERESDTWSDVAGADGEVARSKSNDRRGKITITLLQSSDSNRILSDLALADEASNGGVVPVMVKDGSGNSLHAAREAWVMKPAAAPYGKEADNREWVIRCADLEHYVGGN